MTNTDYIIPTKFLHVKGVTFLIVFIPNLGDLHSKYFLVSMEGHVLCENWRWCTRLIRGNKRVT